MVKQDETRTAIYTAVESEIHDALQKAAASQERTVAGQIRLIVKAWLEERGLLDKRPD